MKIKIYKLIFSIIILTLLTNSYGAEKENFDRFNYLNTNQKCTNISDPFESFNRKMMYFNFIIDYFLVYPVAKLYYDLTNETIRLGVNNFFDNLSQPYSSVNYLIQLKPQYSLLNIWKFFINTIFGVGGVYDVANDLGLEVKKQNMGSTLASYGAGPGIFLYLPLFGPVVARDLPDQFFKPLFNPIRYYNSDKNDYNIEDILFPINIISERANLIGMKSLFENSIDIYVTIKSFYLQNKESELVYPEWFSCKVV